MSVEVLRETELLRARAHVAGRSRDRLLHHVAQVAGHRHLALARHHDGFDGQQFATNLSPGKPGDHADLVFQLGHAIAILRHAQEVVHVLGGDLDLLLLPLGHDQFLGRLAGKRVELALQVTHARLTGIAAHHLGQAIVGQFELALGETVILERLGQQVPAGNFELLVLGVTCNADDLHAVHQRSGNIQRVGRRYEHHVGQVVFHLQVVIHEG